MARKGLIQIWIRGDKEYRKTVSEKAESLGYKTSEYVRRMIDFGMANNVHIFFNGTDDLKHHQTTKELE